MWAELTHLEKALLQRGGEAVGEEVASDEDQTEEGVRALLALCVFLEIE